MAEQYLESSRLSSFPSTKRASMNKLFTENSVTRLINRLVDVESYIITNSLKDVDFTSDILVDNWNTQNLDFEFVIHGYYFCISKKDSVSGLSYLLSQTGFEFDETVTDDHILFARIILDKTDKNYPELYGQDDIQRADGTSRYLAVKFFIDSEEIEYPDGGDPSEYEYYDLPLVKYMISDEDLNKRQRYIPLNSLFKFNSKSIADIDGGEIFI